VCVPVPARRPGAHGAHGAHAQRKAASKEAPQAVGSSGVEHM